MDIELVSELFTRTLDAGRILGEDASFLKQVETARGKLPPFEIGKQGRLQEWQQDYDDAEPGHRHSLTFGHFSRARRSIYEIRLNLPRQRVKHSRSALSMAAGKQVGRAHGW
jgi:hypothetical protein